MINRKKKIDYVMGEFKKLQLNNNLQDKLSIFFLEDEEARVEVIGGTVECLDIKLLKKITKSQES